MTYTMEGKVREELGAKGLFKRYAVLSVFCNYKTLTGMLEVAIIYSKQVKNPREQWSKEYHPDVAVGEILEDIVKELDKR